MSSAAQRTSSQRDSGSKSVPLSVRVSPDDARFISQIDIAGAATPSDKVRALLADARKRREGFSD